jgi:hypothetical protein
MKWSLPSFLLMKKTGAPSRDFNYLMQLVARAFSQKASISVCSVSVIGWTFLKPGNFMLQLNGMIPFLMFRECVEGHFTKHILIVRATLLT